MTPEETRKHLFVRLDETRQQTVHRLKAVDPLRVIYPEMGWRVKDIIAHLTAWEVEVATSLRAYAGGKAYQIENFPGDDIYNDRMFRKYYDLSAEDIFDDWDAVRAGFKSSIRAIDPEYLDGQILCPWGKYSSLTGIVDDMIAHEQEHLQNILGN